MLDGDLDVPDNLAALMTKRRYPALLRGRSETMGRFDGQAAESLTTTYMEKDFSLGTVNTPMGGGEQTMSLHLTYQRRPRVAALRDSATAFVRYLSGAAPYGSSETSADGAYANEKFVANMGWIFTLQKENSALVLTTPNLKTLDGAATSALKLAMIFPAHYGRISRSIIGSGPARQVRNRPERR